MYKSIKQKNNNNIPRKVKDEFMKASRQELFVSRTL